MNTNNRIRRKSSSAVGRRLIDNMCNANILEKLKEIHTAVINMPSYDYLLTQEMLQVCKGRH